ncbi:MAG TPA: universal stress protein [Candidatus Limnocylindrales bacterium]|nr:universal stress protein [Candidatus Limnocylindrales bacterium]
MRVLLAHDGSPGAAEAASLVAALAWPEGSSVRVVAVVEPPIAMLPSVPLAAAPLAAFPEIEAQIAEHLKDEVRGVVEQLRGAGIAAEGEVVPGRPGTILVDEARELGADLVVAGSRGHGSIASLVLGSVSAELVDQAPCPVLVARRPSIERVLLASDGSPSAEHAAALVAQWPMFAGSPVRVLSVADVVRPWHTGIAPTMYRLAVEAYARDLDAAKTEGEAIARKTVARLVEAGRAADEKVRVGDAAAEIIDEAASWGADLIVLGSRGLTGLSRVLLGSVARNVLQGSPSSVLVVREPA